MLPRKKSSTETRFAGHLYCNYGVTFRAVRCCALSTMSCLGPEKNCCSNNTAIQPLTGFCFCPHKSYHLNSLKAFRFLTQRERFEKGIGKAAIQNFKLLPDVLICLPRIECDNPQRLRGSHFWTGGGSETEDENYRERAFGSCGRSADVLVHDVGAQ